MSDHYKDLLNEEEAAEKAAMPDMTPAEALRLIRERCPAREWNVVLGSEIYQYAARWIGQSYERPPADPAIRFACTVWVADEKHYRGDGKTLREAVTKVLPLLPPVPGVCELKLMTIGGVA